MPRKGELDWGAIRARLAAASDQVYWRSLEELADTEEFRQRIEQEFPSTLQPVDAASRREFLRVMAATLALAGLAGCERRPQDPILPYVRSPEHIVPGRPLYFATATEISGQAIGLLVESHEGRPTKIDGNPLHPAVPAVYQAPEDCVALGPTDPFTQASILSLYDPDRSQTVLHLGRISTWSALLETVAERLQVHRAARGRGLYLLTQTVVSPTLGRQLDELLEALPEASWHQWEPIHNDHARRAARMAFGRDVNVIYDFERADVILSLDADFLGCEPAHLRHAHGFAARRRVRPAPDGRQPDGAARRLEMSRLYVVESTFTPTGSKADHRLALRPSRIEAFARLVAARLGIEGDEPPGQVPEAPAVWIDALVDDLQSYRRQDDPGSALVIPGRGQPPVVHLLAHAMNERLAAVGRAVRYMAPFEHRPVDQTQSLVDLVAAMQSGDVQTLLIFGGNPVFDSPGDVPFAEALRRVPLRVHLSMYDDETSALCQWHVPQAHFLESWGDVRAFDGTVSIIQPLIAPLYGGRTSYELMSALVGQPGLSPYDIVRNTWRARLPEDQFEPTWRRALHDGLMPDGDTDMSGGGREESSRETFDAREHAREPLAGGGFVSPSGKTTSLSLVRPVADAAEELLSPGNGTLEIVFRPDPSIWDGRFANNAWLQELPKPLTSHTWDNAALISPLMAERYGLQPEQVIVLELEGRQVALPVLVLPGQPDETVTVHLGYGRTRAGRVGTGVGADVYSLRSADHPWFAHGLAVHRTEAVHPVARTQLHHLMHGRDLVRVGTLQQLRGDPDHPPFMEAQHGPADLSFYPDYAYEGYKWGMAIDLSACVGCKACVVACQAENNIPVVGKAEVLRGREMHWLRIDHYYQGDLNELLAYHQPVPCMHCEKAPCEPVCPVAATVHSSEGLNEMVYNRCVGTRYCSNNCPYKVRRFNFYQYADHDTPVLKLLRNPDVTVRTRGVIEKCTYCVQRISAGRIHAEKQDRRILDGEVVTACQAACPTQAIVFGDLNDPEAMVNTLKRQPLDYALLGELNTRPRTTYLAALRNPNSRIKLHPDRQSAHE